MIIHVLSNPGRAWVCACDEEGIVLDAMPETVRSQWLGKHIEDVRLAAYSILKHRVESIDDNVYPSHTEVRDLKPLELPEVFRAGLRLTEAEKYGEWDDEAGEFPKVPV